MQKSLSSIHTEILSKGSPYLLHFSVFIWLLFFVSSRLNSPLIRSKVRKICFSSVQSKCHHWEVLASTGMYMGVGIGDPLRQLCFNSWFCSCSVPPPNPLLRWSKEKEESHAPCKLGTYFIKGNISSSDNKANTKMK